MTKEMIDPQKLTPASQRALRNIVVGFTVFVLFLIAALGLVIRQANASSTCAARRFSWDFAQDISIRLTAPLPLDGYSGEVLRSRTEANVQRKENRTVLLTALGDNPKC